MRLDLSAVHCPLSLVPCPYRKAIGCACIVLFGFHVRNTIEPWTTGISYSRDVLSLAEVSSHSHIVRTADQPGVGVCMQTSTMNSIIRHDPDKALGPFRTF